jgi:hypothetical protein
MTKGDFERITAERLDPALMRLHQQSIAAEQNAVSKSYRQFGGFDATPVEEAAIYSEVPSLRLLPPIERDRAVLQLTHARRTLAQQNANTQASNFASSPQITAVGPRAQAPAPVMIDPRRVMRQQTYVESAPPSQANSPVEPLTEEAKQMRMNSELNKCKTSQEMEIVINKYYPGSIASTGSDWPGRVASR